MFITNAFSLNMLSYLAATIIVTPLTLEAAREAALGLPSAVGHADTARVFSSQLGIEVPMARVNVSLAPGDQLLVGQYKGPRLPEGATTLPEGATIEWCVVKVL